MSERKPAPARQNFRRFLPASSGALPVLGALIGLLLAGVGLFHAAPRPVTKVPPGYVALVNGEPILMSDFIAQTETVTGGAFADATAAQRRAVLHQMIDQELLVQRGLALNLPETDTDVRASIGESVNSQAAAPILAERPTDDALRAYFQAHLTKYQSMGSMRFHDLLLRYGSYENTDQTLAQALSDATEAVLQLRAGAGLDDVMRHFGFVETASSSADRDDFDFAARIHLGPQVFAAASALSDGDISNPVAAKDGVHVIVMEHRQPPVFTGFDAVRNNVYTDYVADEQKRVQQEDLQLLRKNADIILAPEQQ